MISLFSSFSLAICAAAAAAINTMISNGRVPFNTDDNLVNPTADNRNQLVASQCAEF